MPERAAPGLEVKGDLGQAREILKQLGIAGEIMWTTTRTDPNQFDFQVRRPGHFFFIKADLGLKRVTVRGSYHPTIMALLKSLYEFGLLDPARRVRHAGRESDFQPLLREALMGDGSLRPEGISPRYIMRVRVTGVEGGRSKVALVTLGHDPGWDPLPQGRMTALPAAYTAQLLARRELVHPGICSPEILEDRHVEGCLDLLQARGLWLRREESA